MRSSFVGKISTGVREKLFNLPISPPSSEKNNISEVTNAFSLRIQAQFYKHSIEKSLHLVKHKSDDYWIKRGEERALNLFQEVASRVPAYKDFLKKNKVIAEKIRSIDDFKRIPWIDKKNYLEKYSLDQLSWDGLLESSQMISLSSGSSGTPFYWPRGVLLDIEATFAHEMFLKDIFRVHEQRTLFVNLFAMGMYVAGPLTLNAVLRSAQKGYPLTVITPGLEMRDAVRAIHDLMPNFDQVILAGYPPFVKDIIDLGVSHNINWDKKRIRFLLAGEGFTESWREYLAELVGQKETLTKDFINIYGTADAALVGHETPTSIALRRYAARDEKIFRRIFPEEQGNRLPTFVQYYPTLKYFESLDSELIFTATAGIPLVRYNVHDFGGTISLKKALELADIDKKDLMAEIKSGDDSQEIWNLPFVYLYGKSDQTVTLYGLNIYPENIKMALLDKGIRKLISGRFTMSTEYDDKTKDQYLLLNVELQNNIKESAHVKNDITQIVVKTLRELNAEYNKLFNSIGPDRSQPVISLCEYGDQQHFKRSIKHAWTIK